MVNVDFSNVLLNSIEKKLLKKLNHNKSLPYNEKYDSLINHRYANYCSFIQDDIGSQIPVKDKIEITEQGKAFLKWHKQEKFRFWFPVVISVISLVISFAALLVS